MSLGGGTAPRRPRAGGFPDQTLSLGDPQAQNLKRGRDGYRHERLDQTRRHPWAQEKAPGRPTTQRWHWPPTPAARVSPGTPEHSSPGKTRAHGFLSAATWGSHCPQPLVDPAPSPAGPDTRHHPDPLTPDRGLGPPPAPRDALQASPHGHGSGAAVQVRHASYSCWKHTPVLLGLQAAHCRHTRTHAHTHRPGDQAGPACVGTGLSCGQGSASPGPSMQLHVPVAPGEPPRHVCPLEAWEVCVGKGGGSI